MSCAKLVRDGMDVLTLVSIMPVEIEVLKLENVGKSYVASPKVLHDLSERREAGVTMATAMTVTETFFATRGGFAAHQIRYPQDRADGVECAYRFADQTYLRCTPRGSTDARNLRRLP